MNMRKITLAVGFASIGAISSVGLQALAEPEPEVAGSPHAQGQGAPHAQGQGAGPQKGASQKGAPFMRLMDRIQLTESQEAELADMRDSHQDERHSSRKDGSMRGVLEMLANQELDRGEVHRSIDDRLASQAELMHAHADDYLDFIEGLDPEQKVELAQAAEKFNQRMGERQGSGDRKDNTEGQRGRRSR